MNLRSTIELSAGGPGSGCNPQAGKCGRPSGGVGFVSPNTDEGLTFEQAVSRLSSPEQTQEVQRAQSLLGKGGTVESGVGDWQDGAENSSILKMDNDDADKMDYVSAKLGMEFNQKQVLSFSHDENGKDLVYTLQTGKDMNSVRADLDRAGINFRTLVPSEGGTTVHIFDQGGALTDRITEAANTLGSGVDFIRGNGEFIGGDSREQGRQAFRKIVEAYERTRKVWAGSDRSNQAGWQARIRGWSQEATL